MRRAPQPPGRNGRSSSTSHRTGGGGGGAGHQQSAGDDSENGNNNNAGSMAASAAPLGVAKKKQHQHLLMTQLRNAIYETHQAPPDGATEEMVLERRKQLQFLLDNVEKQYQQSKDEALQAYNDRWLRSFEAQRRREAKLMEENEKRAGNSETQATDVSEHRLSVIRGRNEEKMKRTQSCENALFSRKMKRARELEESMDRKNAVYESIQRRREQEGLDQLRRQIESERKCEEMLRRKQERDEEDRNRKEALAAARRRAADERLEELRLRKEREANERREHASEAYQNASRKKFSVVLRPKPHLEEIKNDYVTRLTHVNTADEDRKARAKRIREERIEMWQATVGARHRKNKEAQEKNMCKKLEEHEETCKELQTKIHNAQEESRRKMAERDAENLLRLQIKDEEVSMHRQRHADTVHNYQDTTKRRVFDRWNRQLEQVSQELGVELPRDAANRHGGGGKQFAAGSGSSAAQAAAGGRRGSTMQQQQQEDGGSGGLDHHSSTFLTQGGRETPQGGSAKFGNALGQ